MPQVPYSPAPTVQNTGAGGNQFNLNVNAEMFGGGTGRALQGLANSIEGLGNVVAQEAISIGKFNQEVDLTDLKTWSDKSLQDGVNNVTGDGMGFKSTFEKGFAERAAALKQKYPAARDFDIKVKELQRGYFGKVNAVQIQKMNDYYKIQLDDKTNEALNDIKANPTDANVKTWVDRMNGLIDKSGLGDAQKEAYKRYVKDSATTYYGYGAAQADPNRVIGAIAGPRSFIDKVGGAESGNRSGMGYHDASKSSAYGTYGFTAGTWAGVVNSPEGKAAGLSIAGLKDPTQQRVGMEILTNKNAAALRTAGIEPNEKNLYMAHFMGAGGATQLIKAMQQNPNQSAAALFPEAAAANGSIFYTRSGGEERTRPRTVAEVYALQTRKFSGEAPAMRGSDPIIAGLPPQEQAKILGVAENFSRARDAAMTAEANAKHADMLNEIGLKVRAGTYTGVDLNQMVANGVITDMKDIEKVESWINKYNEDKSDLSRYLEAEKNGQGLNRFSGADKKAAAAFGDEVEQKVQDPTKRLEVLSNSAARTGIVTPQLMASLLQGANSNNPTSINSAASIALALMRNQPDIFNGVDNGDTMKKLAANYSTLQMMGYPNPGQKLAERNALQAQGKYSYDPKALEEAETKFKNNPVGNGSTKLFEAGIIPRMQLPGIVNANRLELPEQTSIKAAQDYMEMYADAMKLSGSHAEADTFAKERLKQMYGVFNKVAMRYPPSKTYPQDISQSHEYLRQDMINTAARVLGKEVVNVDVRADPLTWADVEAGKSPSYRLAATVKEANGLELMYPVGRWVGTEQMLVAQNDRIRDQRHRAYWGIVTPEDLQGSVANPEAAAVAITNRNIAKKQKELTEGAELPTPADALKKFQKPEFGAR